MTKEEAKEVYRQAWTAWCLTQDPVRKQELEEQMDAVQSTIAYGPGPEWDEFAASLPGFLEFWGRWYLRIKSAYEKKVGDPS